MCSVSYVSRQRSSGSDGQASAATLSILGGGTVALRRPMATAVSAISEYRRATGARCSPSYPRAVSAAAKRRLDSTTATVASQRPREPSSRMARRPPITAPARKAASAAKDLTSEKPGTRASANPRKTTLPVMFAVNTRPSPSTLTASINPVVTVNSSRSSGSDAGCSCPTFPRSDPVISSRRLASSCWGSSPHRGPQARKRDRLSHLHRPKPLCRHAALAQRLCQLAHGLVDSLRGQLERAVMHSDALTRRQIEVRLHGFHRIHVNVLHEPAWLVGPDGE